MMSAGIVDTIYLGHLSTNALAAVMFCFPIVFLGNSVNIGLGAGVMSAISRDLGRKNFEAAHTHGASAIILVIIIMVVVSSLGLVLGPLIVDVMGANEEVRPLSLGYLKYARPAFDFYGYRHGL